MGNIFACLRPNEVAIRPSPDDSSTSDSSTSEQVCPICMTNGMDLAFGCGHVTCEECGSRLSNCPICRVPITTRLKLYRG